jgi:elongation factor P
MVIRHNNDLWIVVEYQHVNPGKGQAFVRTKLKNLKSGKVVENRFRAGESIEIARIERKQYQFLYRDSSSFVFMDNETYEQIPVLDQIVGEGARFIKEGETIDILFDRSDITGLELPITVDLAVVETVPGVRGDTASAGTKPAKVETGATVQVPLFVNEGDLLKIDTRTGAYLERVKS